MAAQKPLKAELIAIYRLEFYKKQKNWKLSTDARKEKEAKEKEIQCSAPIKNSKILNKTYSIDTKVEGETCLLDDAFLKDESDPDSPPSPSAPTSLHTEPLDPINACQECMHTWRPENPWAHYVEESWGAEGQPRGEGDHEEGWHEEGFEGLSDGTAWTNYVLPQGWIGDALASVDMQGGEGGVDPAWAAAELLGGRAPPTPWPDDPWWAELGAAAPLPGPAAPAALESVEEFMLGAHSAPHSSEIELPQDAEPARLSAAALQRAVLRHAAALDQLLHEASARRIHGSTLSLDARPARCLADSCEVVPARDLGLDSCPPEFPAQPPRYTDGFLAGSHRHQHAGRGRGRLPDY